MMEADDLLASSLGRYRIIGQLGEGGMALVYVAVDPRLDRQVAIKVLKMYQLGVKSSTEARQAFLKRFEREAHALARLQHPNIVPIIDFGSAEERYPYLVMPLLSGGTLESKTGRPMHYTEAARLLAPVAEALAYAHRLGIIHRDIKPTNILLTESGDPMLADFGIARFFEQSLVLTASGAFIGTPGYMAPEQWNGTVTSRTDIFALGMVFYELVAGRNPYVAETPQQIMYRQLMEPLPSPRQYAPNLPAPVEQALLRAMAREPEDRYPNMEAFAAVLRRFAVGNLNVTPGSAESASSATVYDAPVVEEGGQTASERQDATAPDYPSLGSTRPDRRGPDFAYSTAYDRAPLPVTSGDAAAASAAAAAAAGAVSNENPASVRLLHWLAWGSAGVTLLVIAGVIAWTVLSSRANHTPLPPSRTAVSQVQTQPASGARLVASPTMNQQEAALATLNARPPRTPTSRSPAAPPTTTPWPTNTTDPALNGKASAATPTLQPLNNILWDCSHGPASSHDGGNYDLAGLYSGMVQLLNANNFQITCAQQAQELMQRNDPIPYGAMVISEWSAAGQAYSSAEADALQGYVGNGGGLLILADKPDSLKHVAPVANLFGVSVGNHPALTKVFDFTGHPITIGLQSIDFYFDGGALETNNADQVVARSDGYPAVIAIDHLPGRVVVVGDANLFDNRGLEHSDNDKFAINIFRWLTHQPGWN